MATPVVVQRDIQKVRYPSIGGNKKVRHSNSQSSEELPTVNQLFFFT